MTSGKNRKNQIIMKKKIMMMMITFVFGNLSKGTQHVQNINGMYVWKSLTI